MSRAEDLGARTPPYVIFEHQIAGIEVRLRPDPHMTADDAPPVETTLNVRLSADKDAVADFKGFEVLEPGAGCRPEAAAPRFARTRQIARRISESR